jgi:hypothetical protein
MQALPRKANPFVCIIREAVTQHTNRTIAILRIAFILLTIVEMSMDFCEYIRRLIETT